MVPSYKDLNGTQNLRIVADEWLRCRVTWLGIAYRREMAKMDSINNRSRTARFGKCRD